MEGLAAEERLVELLALLALLERSGDLRTGLPSTRCRPAFGLAWGCS